MRKADYQTAMIGKWHLSHDAGHGRDWSHSDPKAAGGYYRNQKLSFDGGPLIAVDGYSTDNYTRYALDFIRRPHDKPWLLWLCYDAVHSPYLPAQRHQSRYTRRTRADHRRHLPAAPDQARLHAPLRRLVARPRRRARQRQTPRAARRRAPV